MRKILCFSIAFTLGICLLCNGANGQVIVNISQSPGNFGNPNLNGGDSPGPTMFSTASTFTGNNDTIITDFARNLGDFTVTDGINTGTVSLGYTLTASTNDGSALVAATAVNRGGVGATGVESVGDASNLAAVINGGEVLTISDVTVTSTGGDPFELVGITGFFGGNASVGESLDVAFGGTTATAAFNSGELVAGGVSTVADVFVLDATGSLGLTSIDLVSNVGGVSFNGLQIGVQAVAVPEPGSVALLALGSLGVYFRRRR